MEAQNHFSPTRSIGTYQHIGTALVLFICNLYSIKDSSGCTIVVFLASKNGVISATNMNANYWIFLVSAATFYEVVLSDTGCIVNLHKSYGTYPLNIPPCTRIFLETLRTKNLEYELRYDS